MKKRILCSIAAAAVTALSVVTSAGAYYNAIAEVNQIRDYMGRGMYLEAIRDCGNTIAWHDLSPDDISLLEGYKADAERRYNEYVSGAAGYYNASAEVNQIRSYINRGLYLEAIRDCENTLAWHKLSPDDISLINDLKSTANARYGDYKEAAAAKSRMLGVWHDNSGNPAIEINVKSANSNYADIEIYRTRGKGVEYTLSRAEFIDMDVAVAYGSMSWMDWYTSCTYRFIFNSSSIDLQITESDGTVSTTTFVR